MTMQMSAQVPDQMSDEMSEAVTVGVLAADPLTRAGTLALLEDYPEIEPALGDRAQVVVVVSERLDEATIHAVKVLKRGGAAHVLLLTGEAGERGVAAAINAGVSGILRRSTLDRETLRDAIGAAARSEHVLAPDLLDTLFHRLRAVPGVSDRRTAGDALTVREEAVVQLLSQGCDTREIAKRLSYSERTVKAIVQEVARRFGLRNRTHVVAYALRHDLI